MGFGNGVIVSYAIFPIFDPPKRVVASLQLRKYQKATGLVATMTGEIPHCAFPSSKGDFS